MLSKIEERIGMKWEQRALRMNNEGKREDSSFGRRRLRKTGLWVVGEKPCRSVCSNDSRRPFVVSTLCRPGKTVVTVTDFNVWVQKCTSYTYNTLSMGIVQFFHPCPVLRRLDLSV